MSITGRSKISSKLSAAAESAESKYTDSHDPSFSSLVEVSVEQTTFPDEAYLKVCNILPNLYLTNYFSAINHAKLKELGITHVVTVLSPREALIPAEKMSGVTYKHVAKEDRDWEDILTCFPEVCDYIDSKLSVKGNAVLIHCFMGVSRSGAFTIAYVMRSKKLSFEKAREHVRSRREVVAPNAGFAYQLRLWERFGYKLPIDHWEFRSYLLHSQVFLNYPHSFHNMLLIYWRYLRYFEAADSQNPRVMYAKVYECVKCNKALFTELNKMVAKELPTPIPDRSSTSNRLEAMREEQPCGYIYIEPMRWMKNAFRQFNRVKSGKLLCPSCQAELGNYAFTNRSYHFCLCPNHIGASSFATFAIKPATVRAKSKDGFFDRLFEAIC